MAIARNLVDYSLFQGPQLKKKQKKHIYESTQGYIRERFVFSLTADPSSSGISKPKKKDVFIESSFKGF